MVVQILAAGPPCWRSTVNRRAHQALPNPPRPVPDTVISASAGPKEEFLQNICHYWCINHLAITVVASVAYFSDGVISPSTAKGSLTPKTQLVLPSQMTLLRKLRMFPTSRLEGNFQWQDLECWLVWARKVHEILALSLQSEETRIRLAARNWHLRLPLG